MSVVCYPQPGKARSRQVLEAFAAGARGFVVDQPAPLDTVPCAFYGVVGIEHLLHQARRTRTFYYGDNAFFDRSRGTYFRFAKNEFQLSRLAPPDYGRLERLGVEIKPWRKDGTHIVVVEQSEHFLRLAGADKWLEKTLWALKDRTDRPLRIRHWRRDKNKAAAGLAADLEGAWALVTHMSGAAVEALLAGVPVFTTGPCAASPMSSGPLSDVESPLYFDDRPAWAAGLAGMQWTIDEIRNGMAWRALNGG